MKYPHPIRLRGPWEYRLIDSDSALSGPTSRIESRAAARVRFPSSWPDELEKFFRATVRFTRRFNRPARLDAHERLWLVLDGALAHGSASLNGQSLVADYRQAASAEFEISGHVHATNQLDIDVRRDSERDEPLGEARLEVRSTHFLRAARVTLEDASAAPRLAIRGEVVGGDSPGLAIAAKAAGREIAYGLVRGGQPFEIVSDVRSAVEKVEIELIAGAAALWTEELLVPRSYF